MGTFRERKGLTMAVLKVDKKPPRNRGLEAYKILLKMVIELAY